MHPRLTQHRHHHPPQPPVEDLRARLNRMRDQRESDEAAGIPPPEDSYIYNLPKHQKHAGYPNEKRASSAQGNRSVGQTEWEQGKVVNIKIQVSEGGERMYQMDKEEVIKVPTPEGCQQGPLCGGSSIIKNEFDPGMKTRGRGRYRGAPRGRGYSRGRGRGVFRGRGDGRRGRGRGRGNNGDSASNSSEVTEQDGTERTEGSEGSGEQKEEEVYDDECNSEEYHEDEYADGDYEGGHDDKPIETTIIQSGESKELRKEIVREVSKEETKENQTTEVTKPQETQSSTKSQSDNKPMVEKVNKEEKEENTKQEAAKVVESAEGNLSKSETVDTDNKHLLGESKSETNN